MVPAVESILADIEARRAEMVELCRDLVRIPTVNPPGSDYPEFARYLGARLRERHFELYFERARGSDADSDSFPRINLIARKSGGRPGPCVHFNGHMDVVPPGAGWSVDPFAGEVRDGRIFGRGTADMKGGIAAAVVAVEVLVDRWPDFPGALELSATVDEESGGLAGVGYLAEQGWFDPRRVQHVVIPEPLDPERICIGHRGVWWAEVSLSGRIGHGSMPHLGACAIRHAAAFLQLLEEELRPRLAQRRTAMPVVPEAARRPSLTLHSIHGGQMPPARGLPTPCVADRCTVILDRRFVVEESPDQVRAEVLELLERLARTRPGFAFELRELLLVEPLWGDAGGLLPRTFARAVEEVLGIAPAFVCSPGTYDHKHVLRIGRQPSCIAYGPGRLEQAHQPDEHIAIDDMVRASQVMALAALRLLTQAQTP